MHTKSGYACAGVASRTGALDLYRIVIYTGELLCARVNLGPNKEMHKKSYACAGVASRMGALDPYRILIYTGELPCASANPGPNQEYIQCTQRVVTPRGGRLQDGDALGL